MGLIKIVETNIKSSKGKWYWYLVHNQLGKMANPTHRIPILTFGPLDRTLYEWVLFSKLILFHLTKIIPVQRNMLFKTFAKKKK